MQLEAEEVADLLSNPNVQVWKLHNVLNIEALNL